MIRNLFQVISRGSLVDPLVVRDGDVTSMDVVGHLIQLKHRDQLLLHAQVDEKLEK